jgi:hypothetical protein
VQANARVTASTGALLLLVLALEGVTILSVRRLLTAHVVIGMILVPPVVLKVASTTYRFVRYYRGDPAYRAKGPPPVLLRLAGPFVVVLTVLVLASGIALLLAPPAWHQQLLLAHKASFVLWFGVMAIHVLGHLLETTRLAPLDWYHRTRREVAGAAARQWLLVVSVALGLLLGVLLAPHVGSYLTTRPAGR